MQRAEQWEVDSREMAAAPNTTACTTNEASLAKGVRSITEKTRSGLRGGSAQDFTLSAMLTPVTSAGESSSESASEDVDEETAEHLRRLAANYEQLAANYEQMQMQRLCSRAQRKPQARAFPGAMPTVEDSVGPSPPESPVVARRSSTPGHRNCPGFDVSPTFDDHGVAASNIAAAVDSAEGLEISHDVASNIDAHDVAASDIGAAVDEAGGEDSADRADRADRASA